MITLDNQTNIEININILEKISKTDKEIELVIVDNKTMQTINFEQREVDKTTDVLSFPLEDFPHFPLGSIVINSDLATIKAKELGHDFKDEITLMFIHGLLHVKGYDHECDNGEMRKEEEKLIKEFNLPKSLIIRTDS
ncbi:MAG TPA: rRNA maturation RNase YbeY [Sulfurospirillum arcachonense]|nr:rRNA maturation RNase YbeY [Sulfurospirillum arcachonense]HIP44009.1 rRNA maturation RNase YbeY [Sulfurospirillum arcachonense]